MKKKLILSVLSLLLAACQPHAIPMPAPASVTPVVGDAVTNTPPAILQTPTPALDAAETPPSVRISPNDGMTQLHVPEGTFHRGGLDIFAENDEVPPRQVGINSFWIDQVEVTNGMYGLCVASGSCEPPVKTNSDNRADYFRNPEFKDYPVVYVTWREARIYCEWAGRRLPTEAEWERAARGDDMRTYPWGDEPPTAEFANLNNDLGDTSRVGSYAAGASPFGALDMAGNIWEWVADYYDVAYYVEAPDVNPTGPADRIGKYSRVIRGGSFQDPPVNLRISNRGYELGPNPSVLPIDPAYYGRSSVKIGFRCAADP